MIRSSLRPLRPLRPAGAATLLLAAIGLLAGCDPAGGGEPMHPVQARAGGDLDGSWTSISVSVDGRVDERGDAYMIFDAPEDGAGELEWTLEESDLARTRIDGRFGVVREGAAISIYDAAVSGGRGSTDTTLAFDIRLSPLADTLWVDGVLGDDTLHLVLVPADPRARR